MRLFRRNKAARQELLRDFLIAGERLDKGWVEVEVHRNSDLKAQLNRIENMLEKLTQ